MTTVSIVFDHRNRTKKGNNGPLEVRLTVGRKQYYIGTGVRVRKEQWKHGEVVNHEQGAELTERVNMVARWVWQYVNDRDKENRPIILEEVRRVVSRSLVGEDVKRTEFLDWCVEQKPLMGLGEGTLKHYDTLFTRLKEFGMTSFDDLTVENIIRWDAWLHQLKKAQTDNEKNAKKEPERISDAAVWNYHKRLKAMINRAVVVGKVDRNPYDRLKGQFRRGEHENVEYLTEVEMKAFMSLRPIAGTQMAISRDLFVFQMFTGLSYSDAQAFDISDYKNVDGRWVHIGERIKTGVSYVSELLPPAVEVLERYGMNVPRIGNGDYNKNLKALGMAAGISTPLHSHLARHTFATWMLSNGAKIENVSRMLGHTNITQTQRYAKVLAKDVHDDFDKAKERLKDL